MPNHNKSPSYHPENNPYGELPPETPAPIYGSEKQTFVTDPEYDSGATIGDVSAASEMSIGRQPDGTINFGTFEEQEFPFALGLTAEQGSVQAETIRAIQQEQAWQTDLEARVDVEEHDRSKMRRIKIGRAIVGFFSRLGRSRGQEAAPQSSEPSSYQNGNQEENPFAQLAEQHEQRHTPQSPDAGVRWNQPAPDPEWVSNYKKDVEKRQV